MRRQRCIGMQLALAEHQPEAARVLQRKAHVGLALAAQRGARIGAATRVAGAQGLGQGLETQAGHRRQQPGRIAEMMRGRGRRHAGTARHLAQREGLGAALGQQRFGGLHQRLAQRAVVVGRGHVTHARMVT